MIKAVSSVDIEKMNNVVLCNYGEGVAMSGEFERMVDSEMALFKVWFEILEGEEIDNENIRQIYLCVRY